MSPAADAPAMRRNCAALYAPPSRRVNPRIAKNIKKKTVYLAGRGGFPLSPFPFFC